ASVARAEGNLAGAARLLGITRPQLSYRLKKKPGAEPGEEITRE
ncbi:MAG TPA: helix-turn-helix domain-containing protein, partial [Rhodocyclaceae bacterium]|nr:helix-turn-helix domain-containing protein [Rhodocyclaceae bacterium]